MLHLNPREKLEAIFKHGKPGHSPRALWRHFPHEDYQSEAFVAAQCDFIRRYRMDLCKITPRSSYGLRDYGAMDVFAGDYLGRPKYVNRVITAAIQWESLPVLNPRHGCLQQMLEITHAIVAQLGQEYPVILTVFSPLTQAGNMTGIDALASQWETNPASVRQGLAALTQSTIGFLEALKTTGIDGIYYAVQESNWPRAMENGLLEAAHPLNRAIMAAAGGWLNIIHVHGKGQQFADYARYPAQILHWDHHGSGIDTATGARLFPGTVSGSIAWPLSDDPLGEESIRAQVRQALSSGLGSRELLCSECVIPFETPARWIDAFFQASTL